jgi:caa(3)-type oxidase subunit IV
MSDTKKSHHHILPVRTYMLVGGALLLATVLTVFQAQLHLGATSLVIAMIVAAAKGSLVALVFMHLKWDSKLYAVVFVGAIAFFALFVSLTMFDTQRRGDIYDVRNDKVQNEAVIYRQPSVPGEPGEAEAVGDSAAISTADTADAEVDTSTTAQSSP